MRDNERITEETRIVDLQRDIMLIDQGRKGKKDALQPLLLVCAGSCALAFGGAPFFPAVFCNHLVSLTILLCLISVFPLIRDAFA